MPALSERPGRHPLRPRRIPGGAFAALALTSALVAGRATAQDQVRNFREPILIAETEGHQAPVWGLAWPDSSTLLSGGDDKVVKVWDLQERRPVRSIRPPLWRGPAGTIYALALSPRKAGDAGPRFVAVGGFGIQPYRGDLTVYRYSDGDPSPTGEPVARLLCRDPNVPNSIGHSGAVRCLAFDPTGRWLVSGSFTRAGHPEDLNLIVWDAANQFRPSRALRGHVGAVNTLAFAPDGRLATAGNDGSVRTWDVGRGVALDTRPASNPNAPFQINTLAISPDGGSLVIGTETPGRLFRFDARNLGAPAVALPTKPTQGPVEFVAFRPDGRQLVVSILSDRGGPFGTQGIRPTDIEIRAWPAGNVTSTRRAAGLVHVCAFNPDGSVLAIAGGPVRVVGPDGSMIPFAGGPSQAITLIDPRAPNLAPTELKGQGGTILDVGFTRDSQVVGFTRDRAASDVPPPLYEGFDLGRRTLRTISPAALAGAVKQLGGWTIRSNFDQYLLEAVNTDGRRWKLDVNRVNERNWWSYSFLPPGPGHSRPAVAIGTDAGVIVYDLTTGRRTRMFAGHLAAVTALAPSPDGRWLASGSVDQTIRLYPLAGSDQLPAFGAGFRRQGNELSVARVDPGSFAQATGLAVGDLILDGGISSITETGAVVNSRFRTPKELDDFVARLDGLKPYLDQIDIGFKKRLFEPFFGDVEIDLARPSTKRDNPALTLLAGQDREWVLWTPRGYYETSIEGDTRLLGWHLNPPFDAVRPTDFVPIGTYAAKMRKPDVLDRIWQTGDLPQALALLPPGTPTPAQVAEQDQPPRIEIALADLGLRLPGPGAVWIVNSPSPRLNVTISSQGKSPIAARRLVFDEKGLERPPLVAPVALLREVVEMPAALRPNQPARLVVRATNANGSPRTEFVDLVYVPVKTQVVHEVSVRAPRLVVLSVGSGQFANGLPEVKFAKEDADSLADHFTKHLIPHAGVKSFEVRPQDRVVITGKAATAESIARAFDGLRKMIDKKELDKGDLVCVVIASHVLDLDQDTRIATVDTTKTLPPLPSLQAQLIGEQLGELADYGCRTVLFLDGVHELDDKELKAGIKEWVRDLQQNRQVVTFVASKEGPSGADVPQQHGYFALGLLHAFQAAGAAAARSDRNAPYTLGQFKTAVVQEVLNLSGRQQEVGCYVPPSVSLRTWFARP